VIVETREDLLNILRVSSETGVGFRTMSRATSSLRLSPQRRAGPALERCLSAFASMQAKLSLPIDRLSRAGSLLDRMDDANVALAFFAGAKHTQVTPSILVLGPRGSLRSGPTGALAGGGRRGPRETGAGGAARPFVEHEIVQLS
jgi:hypothetical protein